MSSFFNCKKMNASFIVYYNVVYCKNTKTKFYISKTYRRNSMKVWIIKYALTQGIIEAEAEEIDERFIRVPNKNYCDSYYHGEGKDWCKTKESAIQKAEEKRKKEIIRLKKKIEKLENMKFKIVTNED